MIWLITLFTMVSWWTPILSVMPSAYAYSMEGTKLNKGRYGFLFLYYTVMAIQSVEWCGVAGSVIMNAVCLVSYVLPIYLLVRSNMNPMWKLLITEIIYFVVTNFYSWCVMPDYYARDLSGLFACYLAAIPFFGKSLISCFGYYALFRELQKIRIKNYGMSISNKELQEN